MKRILKQQAIELLGCDVVEKVGAQGCDFTNRATDGTEWQGYTEFAASVPAKDNDGNDVILVAYWFMDSEDVANCDDLSNLSWGEPDNYMIN